MMGNDQLMFPAFPVSFIGITYSGLTVKQYLMGQILPALLNHKNLSDSMITRIEDVGYVTVAYQLINEIKEEEAKCH